MLLCMCILLLFKYIITVQEVHGMESFKIISARLLTLSVAHVSKYPSSSSVNDELSPDSRQNK